MKPKDHVVCVHIIENYSKVSPDKKQFIQPDIRSNKPEGIHIKNEDQIAFFQKILYTEINGKELAVAIPNEIALSISTSQKAQQAASELKGAILKSPNLGTKTVFKKNQIKEIYDYLEEIQKSIIFSYKAVEAFCNASIPEKFTYKKANNKGIVEEYGKHEIERWIITSEKLSQVLPACLKVDLPKNNQVWSNFKNLERLRNEIVHSKSHNSFEVLSELFSKKVDDYIDSALLLLEHFASADECNPAFPLGLGLSKINITSIPNAEDRFTELIAKI